MTIAAIEASDVILRMWPIFTSAALVFGIGFLWNKRRQAKQSKGQPMASYSVVLRNITNFIFKDDKKPVYKTKDEEDKETGLAKTYPYIQQARFTYLAGIIISTITLLAYAFSVVDFNPVYLFIVPGILTVIISSRAGRVFPTRTKTLIRMFEVANSEFKYPRGSEINPWAYVNIKEWVGDTTPGETTVNFPAGWKDSPKLREEFENHFKGTVTDQNSWSYDWNPAEGKVVCKPVPHLPKKASYPGSGDHPWNEIPLGAGIDGDVCWDVTVAPHMLVCGPTGSGKSVFQRNVFFHLLQYSDRWSFIGIDPKRVELSPYSKYKDIVLGIGTDLEDGVELVRFADNMMNERYKMMEDMGVNNFVDLPNPPKAILIMIDETTMFLSPSGIKSDEGKEIDALKAEASILLGNIARLGRAAGVFSLLALQRPDATVIKGELKNNLDARVACGRMDSTPSMMVLDSIAATLLPKVKGRGVYREAGREMQFQGFFAPQSWADEYLEKRDRKSQTVESEAEEVEPEKPTKKDKSKKKKGGLMGKINEMNEKAKNRFDDEEGEKPSDNDEEPKEKPSSNYEESHLKDIEEANDDEGFEQMTSSPPVATIQEDSPSNDTEDEEEEWSDPFAGLLPTPKTPKKEEQTSEDNDEWEDPFK